jgi:hypothetical protein
MLFKEIIPVLVSETDKYTLWAKHRITDWHSDQKRSVLKKDLT